MTAPMVHNCHEPDVSVGDRWRCGECGRLWRVDEEGSTRINRDGTQWRQ